jgi:hypothetical protein
MTRKLSLIESSYERVQIRKEGRNLAIVTIPQDKREERKARFHIVWHRYIEGSFVTITMSIIFASFVFLEASVFYISTNIPTKILIGSIIVIPVLTILLYPTAHFLWWALEAYQKRYKKYFLGKLKTEIWLGFVEKFALEKTSLGWSIERKFLNIGIIFYNKNAEMFQKATENSESIEEFKILYGLRN